MEIFEHMEVVDANEQHVGTVDKVEGDRVCVEDNKVKLSQKVSAITTRAFVS